MSENWHDFTMELKSVDKEPHNDPFFKSSFPHSEALPQNEDHKLRFYSIVFLSLLMVLENLPVVSSSLLPSSLLTGFITDFITSFVTEVSLNMDFMLWAGILLCLLQSGLFSGLTLGLFGLSQLQLEVEVESGFQEAHIVLNLRKDANFLLSTLLWGNVSINVLLTLLTESALTGMWAFFLSSISITILGEIIPQAYFSRNALKMGVRLAPLVRVYQVLLYPVAKPTALLLDQWLGKEGVRYLDEENFCVMLKKHIDSQESDIGSMEGTGALNFLSLDDLSIGDEGEVLHPKSIIQMETENNLSVFPQFQRRPEDPFLQQIEASKEKWVILTNEAGEPILVLDADAFLRDALFRSTSFRPYAYCHRPLVVHDPETRLGSILHHLRVHPEHQEDDVIDKDIILCWSSEKRILTGADILGRLLRGIVVRGKRRF